MDTEIPVLFTRTMFLLDRIPVVSNEGLFDVEDGVINGFSPVDNGHRLGVDSDINTRETGAVGTSTDVTALKIIRHLIGAVREDVRGKRAIAHGHGDEVGWSNFVEFLFADLFFDVGQGVDHDLITGRAVRRIANGVETEIKTVALVTIFEDRETVGVV